MNLSPVVDLASSGDQLMYSRSISDNVETVSDYAVYAAKFIQPKKISVTLSHFPGCGTIPDSAVTGSGAIEDDRSADTIRNTDYKPFKAGIDADMPPFAFPLTFGIPRALMVGAVGGETGLSVTDTEGIEGNLRISTAGD